MFSIIFVVLYETRYYQQNYFFVLQTSNYRPIHFRKGELHVFQDFESNAEIADNDAHFLRLNDYCFPISKYLLNIYSFAAVFIMRL